MKKKLSLKVRLNIFMLSIILFNVFYSPVMGAAQYVSSKNTKTTHKVEDVNQLDWDTYQIGDTLDIDYQTLDQFNQYRIVPEEQSDGTYSYSVDYYFNPTTNTLEVENKPENDNVSYSLLVESKYQIDLDYDYYFGANFESTQEDGSKYFGVNGFIQLWTRPFYDRINPSINYANSGSKEIGWYLTNDANSSKLREQYKENGNFKSSRNDLPKQEYNTMTVSVDTDTNTSTFSHCTLPEGDTSANCFNGNAQNSYPLSSSISSTYMDNEFLGIRLSPGIKSELDIKNFTIYAKVKSYGDITFARPNLTVYTGTTLEQVHNKLDPVYNEFIDYQVTEVGREVQFNELVDDGGYDANTPGTYTLTYETDNGYDTTTKTQSQTTVTVADPDQTAQITAENTVIDLDYAPTTEKELISLMNVEAYDPNYEIDITNQVKIGSVGTYDYNNPKMGRYPITFYVTGSDGKLAVSTAYMTLTSPAYYERIEYDEEIKQDEDNDMVISPGEHVTVATTIDNQSRVDTPKMDVNYTLDDSFLDINTFSNLQINGEEVDYTLNDNVVSFRVPQIYIDEQLVITYDITSKSKWYIGNEDIDFEEIHNIIEILPFNNSFGEELSLPVSGNTFNDFVSTFEYVDEDGNKKIKTDEDVFFTQTFTNDSSYYINAASYHLSETTSKFTNLVSDLNVTSDKRTLTTADYKTTDDNTLYVYDILPHEKITITYTRHTKEEFANRKDADLNAIGQIYIDSSAQNVFGEQITNIKIPIDIDAVLDYDFDIELTDGNNEKLVNNEDFYLNITFNNTGSLDLTNLEFNVDLEDLNIKTDALTKDNTSVGIAGNSVTGSSDYTIDGNKITLYSLGATDTAAITIKLTSEDLIDTENFQSDLTKVDIKSAVTINHPLITDVNEELSIPVDYSSTENFEHQVTVSELQGDGDGKVDPNEQFEYNLQMNNNGDIDLDQLKIDLDLHKTAGITVSNDSIALYNEDGSLFTDYTVEDNVFTINHLDAQSEIVGKLIVTYGDTISGNEIETSYTISHPYFKQDIVDSTSVPIDLDNNRALEAQLLANVETATTNSPIEYTLQINNTGATVENDLEFSLDLDGNNMDEDSIVINSVTTTPTRKDVNYQIEDGVLKIDTIVPHEQIDINFTVNTNEKFYVDPSKANDFTIDTAANIYISSTDSYYKVQNQIGLLSDIDYELTGNVTSLNNKGYAVHNDVLTYHFTLVNNSDTNMTNGVIDYNLTNPDIKTVNGVSITSDDRAFTYKIDSENKKMTYSNLNVGKKIDVYVTASVNNTLTSTPTIDDSIKLSSDLFSDQIDFSIPKNVEDEESITVSSKLISTSSGNMLMGEDEIITYDLTINNNGYIDVDDLTVKTDLSSENYLDETLVSIKNSDGSTYNGAYTYENSTLVFDKVKPGEKLTIRFKINTNNTIEYVENNMIENNVSSSVTNINNELPVSIDLSKLGDLEIDMTSQGVPGYADLDGKLDPGEVIRVTTTVKNTGSINIDDVFLQDMTEDINLKDGITDFEIVDQDGNTFTDYTQVGNSIHLEYIASDTTLYISYNITAKDIFKEADLATFQVQSTATYPSLGQQSTLHQDTYPIDRANNTSVDLTIDGKNVNGTDVVKPGDQIKLDISLTNNGKIDIDQLELLSNTDVNLDYDTAKIALTDIFDASITGNGVTINGLDAGETVNVILYINTKSPLYPADEITGILSVNHEYLDDVATDTVDIDHSDASISTVITKVSETGDGDSKIDAKETFRLNAQVKNTSDYILDNVVIDIDDTNIDTKSISNITTTEQVNGNQITFDSMMPNEVVNIEFDVNINDTLSSATNVVQSITTQADYVSPFTESYEIAIDINNATSVLTSLKAVDSTGDYEIEAGEKISYQFMIQNDGSRTISDLTITNTLDENNLVPVLENHNISYNDEQIDVNSIYDAEKMEYEFVDFKPGDEIAITYDIYANTIFNRDVIRALINYYVTNKFEYHDALGYLNDSDTSKLKVSDNVIELQSTARFIDSSKNNLLAANEEYNYVVNLENTGAVRLDDVIIKNTISGKNSNPYSNIVIKDELGNELKVNEDYSISENNITIFEIEPNTKLEIVYTAQAKPTIFTSSDLTVKTVISNPLFNDQTILNVLKPDLSSRDFNQSLSTSKTIDESNLDDEFSFIYTLENKGNTNETQVLIDTNNIDDNLVYTNDDYVVKLNGTDITGSTKFNDGIIELSSVNAKDVVTITRNVKFKQSIVDNDSSDIAIKINSSYNAKTAYDSAINKAQNVIDLDGYKLSTIEVETQLDESSKQNDLANANEKISGIIHIKNDNYLAHSNVQTTIALSEENIDMDSLKVTNIVREDGSEIEIDDLGKIHFESDLDNNIILVLDELDGHSEYDIYYEYQVKDNLTYNEDNDITQLALTTNVNVWDKHTGDIKAAASMNVDPNSTQVSLSSTYENLTTGKKTAKSGDVIEYTYVVENTGTMNENNVPFRTVPGDQNYQSDNILNLTIDLDGKNLVEGIDYSYDRANHTLTFDKLPKGSIITIKETYLIPSQLINNDELITTNIVQNNLGENVVSKVAIPLDFSNNEVVQITEEYSESDDSDLLVSEGEEVSYQMTITNNGDIDYLSMPILIDGSRANIDFETVEYSVNNNTDGYANYELETLDEENAIYMLTLLDVNVGTEYQINLQYNTNDSLPTGRLRIKSQINTTGLTYSNSNYLTPNANVVTPELDREDPYIETQDINVNEGTKLSDKELIEKIVTSSNQSSTRLLSYSTDVNYDKPGKYPVYLTLDDLESGKVAQETAFVTVNDLKPSISAKSNVNVQKGEVISDYISEYNVEATEINKGDLTNDVSVDDSQVNYQVTGKYSVIFTVIDDEGNDVDKTSYVSVYNSLSPVITADSITLTVNEANNLVSDEMILEAIGAKAYDYDGTNLTSEIEINDQDDFLNSNKVIGDVYNFDLSISNELNYQNNASASIEIVADNNDYETIITANNPLAFKISDNVSLSTITEIANPVSNIYQYDKLIDQTQLTTQDIVATNFVQNEEGVYYVVYQDTNYSNTTNFIETIYVNESGTLPNNQGIETSYTTNEQISSGDDIKGELTIKNNSKTPQVIRNVSGHIDSSNLKQLESISFTDNAGNISLISDLKDFVTTINPGEVVKLNYVYSTKTEFNDETKILTSVSYKVGGKDYADQSLIEVIDNDEDLNENTENNENISKPTDNNNNNNNEDNTIEEFNNTKNSLSKTAIVSMNIFAILVSLLLLIIVRRKFM